MSTTRAPLGLWFAAFAGPLAWSAHSLLSTALVPVACAAGAWLMYALTLLLALVALVGVVVALRGRGQTSWSGRQFVAHVSIFTDAFFMLVILAEGVPNVLLNPCWS